MGSLRVAVAGATGLVGRTILQVLEERDFPIRELVPLASERSIGKRLRFRGEDIAVQILGDESFAGVDVAFFSAGASVSRRFAPVAARSGALVVDNSSAFRQDPEIPLVVPEVNGDALMAATLQRMRHPDQVGTIIANPNCSTIQMVVALNPLHRVFGLQTVIVATYQSVSGTGGKGVRALEHEMASGERHPESPYPHPIAYNVLPHIDVFDDEGWSGEERKMMAETRKIMGLPALHIVPTTVRVPVRVSHSESVYARFVRPVDRARVRQLLAEASGVVVIDEPHEGRYPLALMAEGHDEVFVGRIRQVAGDEHGLSLWVVGDNLRKGAATNAVQIAEVAMAPWIQEVSTAQHV